MACRRHMAQLRQDYDKFVTQDTEIIVVGPEKAKAFKNYWDRNNLPFIGLSDPKHKVLKLYGQEVNLFKLGRMPAQVIIDKDGLARYIHYGQSMADIPKNDELLHLLKEINQKKSSEKFPEKRSQSPASQVLAASSD
jgi:peroxiredoxin